ncbi:MAG: carboxypeptidase-like regulatory domain-containing protein, partial [Candidatus Cryptobacteroides sp.]
TTIVPGDYVMVYSKDEGMGTQSNEDGYFSIDINKYGTVKLEFSRIGYTTVFLDVDTRYDIDLGEIILEPQVLMLTAAFVTPEGMTSAEYILSRLWRQSRENREKKSDYQAEIQFNVATHEIPMVAGVLPGITTGFVKFVAAVKGYGPLVKYCLEEDEFSASVRLDRVVRRGKTTDYNKKLLSGEDLLPKVQKNLLNLFSLIDLFDILYSTATSWGENFSN